MQKGFFMRKKLRNKALVLVLGLALIGGITGCGKQKSNDADETAENITVEQLIDEVYQNTDSSLYSNSVQTVPVDVTDKVSMNYYLGVDELNGLENAACSEPMMSSIAHSVVALKFDNTSNATAAAESLKQTAPVQKWVCVEPAAITTKVVYDTYVIFSMSSVDFINNLNNMTIERR